MNGYLFVVFATLFWSPIGVLTKLAGDGIHPITLNFYRIFFAFIAIIFVIPLLDKTTFKVKKSDLKEYVLVGFLLAVAMLLNTLSFIYGTVSNATVLIYTYPIFVMVFGLIILKEKATWKKILIFTIAFLGIALMNPFQINSEINGNLIALFAAIFSGLVTVMFRKEDVNHGIGDVFWFFFFASLFMLPIPFIFGFGDFSGVTIFIILLGLFTAGYHTLINLGMQKVESYLASIIDLIITPLIAILLAVFIIGEKVTLTLVIAGVLIVSAGLILIRTKKSKRHKTSIT